MTQRVTQSNKFGMAAEAKTPADQLKAKTSSQTLAAANEARVALVIVNNGATAVWLACGATAVAEKGIMLGKEGGATVIDYYSGIVTAISKEGEPILSFTEV